MFCLTNAFRSGSRGNCWSTLSARCRKRGPSGKKDGEPLALMSAAGFEVLVTVDQGIRYQQNLQAAGVAVVVMIAACNQLTDLIPLVPNVLAVMGHAAPR